MTDKCPEIIDVIQGQRKTLTFNIFLENDTVADLSEVGEIQLFMPQLPEGFLRLLKTTLAVKEKTKVTTVADVGGALNNKYFEHDTVDNKYYIWFNVGGVGADPNVDAREGIEIAVATNDTANAIAALIQTAMDLKADMGVAVVGPDVTIINATGGEVANTADALESADQTGFTFLTEVEGVDGGPTVIVGTNQIQQILTERITKLLKDENAATAFLAVHFKSPTGRQLFEFKKAYNVIKTDFDLA